MSVCIAHARESTMLVLLHLKTLLDHCIGYHYIVIVDIERKVVRLARLSFVAREVVGSNYLRLTLDFDESFLLNLS